MTKRDVEIQVLLLRHRANGCISAITKWQESLNHEAAKDAIPALRARFHQLEAEANGLEALAEQWDEFGAYFQPIPPEDIQG